MPDLDYELEDDTDETDDGSLPAKLRKQVREANKKVAELEQRAAANEAAARRVAFLDAQIPEGPQTKFFREKYDGELTADAIRAAAIEHGFLDDATPGAQASVAGITEQSAAMAGAEPLVGIGSQEEYERAIDEAVSRAPQGMESAAIAEVYRRYAGVVDNT